MAATHSSSSSSSHYRSYISPLLLILFLFLQAATCAPTPPTSKFLLPLVKDFNRLKYYTSFQAGTPGVRLYLTVDIGNQYNWVHGNLSGYTNSSTYRVVKCYSAACKAYSGTIAACFGCSCSDCSGKQPPSPTCNSNQCASLINTPPSRNAFLAPLVEDITTLFRFNPQYSPRLLTKTSLARFPFASTEYTGPLKGLSQFTKGVLTLSRSPIAIHTVIANAFKTPRVFAICLPSSSSLNGAVYFGGGPYILPPINTDLSTSFVSMQLLNHSKSYIQQYDLGDPSFEYYINIKSIVIDGSMVPFNKSLLGFDQLGNGGSKLSTMMHYTSLHSQIYKPFVELFAAKAKALNIVRVQAVSPFGACFSSNSIRYNAKRGVGLPVIDIVNAMDGTKSAKWKIYGSNSMVKISDHVHCLAFVDAGPPKPIEVQGVTASVVIGGKQMEDNLIEFDLESSKVGITSSLLKLGTSCSQFKESKV